MASSSVNLEADGGRIQRGNELEHGALPVAQTIVTKPAFGRFTPVEERRVLRLATYERGFR